MPIERLRIPGILESRGLVHFPYRAKLEGGLNQHDAAYVALAEVLQATLLTGDQRLSSSTGPRCPIELVEAHA